MDKIFRKLFKKQKPVSQESLRVDTRPTFYTSQASEAATAPLSEDQLAEIAMQTKRIEPMQLIAGAARDVGRTREKNEDSLFYHVSLIDAGQSSVPFGIFIVADGMGGHRYGEAASEAAARTMGNYLFGKLYNSLYATNPQPPSESLQEILRKGVQKAHENVVENAPGGGTTLTTVLSIGSQMTIAHVGDSRAYAIYLDGRMQVLTRDHSLVKRLEELGQITSEEAAVHPQKSMLYRALGQGDSPEPDVFSASMPHPGYLMICSDGLWGAVPQDRIFEVISDSPSPQRACQSLVDMANAAGGPDNISVILVRLSD